MANILGMEVLKGGDSFFFLTFTFLKAPSASISSFEKEDSISKDASKGFYKIS